MELHQLSDGTLDYSVILILRIPGVNKPHEQFGDEKVTQAQKTG